jgi:hypothetical protein
VAGHGVRGLAVGSLGGGALRCVRTHEERLSVDAGAARSM